MKSVLIGITIAAAGFFSPVALAVSNATPTTVHPMGNSSSQGPNDGSPSRPGAKTHFPRNGMTHETPATFPTSGAQSGAIPPSLRATEGAALGR